MLSGEKDDNQSETLQISKSSAIRAVYPDRPTTSSGLDVQTVSATEVTAQSLEMLFTDTANIKHKAFLEILGQNVLPRAAQNIAPRKWYFLSNRHGDPEEEARVLIAWF